MKVRITGETADRIREQLHMQAYEIGKQCFVKDRHDRYVYQTCYGKRIFTFEVMGKIIFHGRRTQIIEYVTDKDFLNGELLESSRPDIPWTRRTDEGNPLLANYNSSFIPAFLDDNGDAICMNGEICQFCGSPNIEEIKSEECNCDCKDINLCSCVITYFTTICKNCSRIIHEEIYDYYSNLIKSYHPRALCKNNLNRVDNNNITNNYSNSIIENHPLLKGYLLKEDKYSMRSRKPKTIKKYRKSKE
jgi:hypothetical protein